MRAALTALAAAGLLATIPVPSAAAKPRDCGAITFSGTDTHIVVLRGASCAVAKEIAVHFSVTSAGPQGASGWRCAFAHAPFTKIKGRTVGFSCGKGGSGDLRKRPHAFVGTVAR